MPSTPRSSIGVPGCEPTPASPGHPNDPRLEVESDVREALGAETLMYFSLAAPRVDSGDPDALDEVGHEDESRCIARFSAASRARPGDRIKVNVSTEKVHFFERGSHLTIRS